MKSQKLTFRNGSTRPLAETPHVVLLSVISSEIYFLTSARLIIVSRLFFSSSGQPGRILSVLLLIFQSPSSVRSLAFPFEDKHGRPSCRTRAELLERIMVRTKVLCVADTVAFLRCGLAVFIVFVPKKLVLDDEEEEDGNK